MQSVQWIRGRAWVKRGRPFYGKKWPLGASKRPRVKNLIWLVRPAVLVVIGRGITRVFAPIKISIRCTALLSTSLALLVPRRTPAARLSTTRLGEGATAAPANNRILSWLLVASKQVPKLSKNNLWVKKCFLKVFSVPWLELLRPCCGGW